MTHFFLGGVNINLANENPYYIQIKETIVMNLTLRKQYENKLFKIIGKIKQHKRLHCFLVKTR